MRETLYQMATGEELFGSDDSSLWECALDSYFKVLQGRASEKSKNTKSKPSDLVVLDEW